MRGRVVVLRRGLERELQCCVSRYVVICVHVSHSSNRTVVAGGPAVLEWVPWCRDRDGGEDLDVRCRLYTSKGCVSVPTLH